MNAQSSGRWSLTTTRRMSTKRRTTEPKSIVLWIVQFTWKNTGFTWKQWIQALIAMRNKIHSRECGDLAYYCYPRDMHKFALQKNKSNENRIQTTRKGLDKKTAKKIFQLSVLDDFFQSIFIDKRLDYRSSKNLLLTEYVGDNETASQRATLAYSIFSYFSRAKNDERRLLAYWNSGWHAIYLFFCQSVSIVFNRIGRTSQSRYWTETRISGCQVRFEMSTFELWASSTLTLLSSRSNSSCCFRYRSASAKLLLLPCSLCRNPPKAFSSISYEH